MSDDFSNGSDIKKEIDDLIKNYSKRHRSDYSILVDLEKKYGSKKGRQMLEQYKKEMENTKKFAEKIKGRLLEKYPNLTLDQYIKKVGEYGKKYDLSSAVTGAIKYMLFTKDKRSDFSREYDKPFTKMSKALGYVPKSYHFSGSLDMMGEEEEVQALIRLHAETSDLHDQVQLQSLIYESCSPSALMNDFRREKVNMFQYVHPIFFALFFPKIPICDRHMLFASIPNIVKRKYEGEDLQTQPDVELYDDICTDPVETTCSPNNNKPFLDLLSRAHVQIVVWENVISVRQGKFYTSNINSFITAINNCKANIFDMADYAYQKDEGTIFRKLFAVFSLRPTLVSISPTMPGMVLGQSQHIGQIYAPHITSIPMIPLRMNDANMNVENAEPLNLSSALNDRQVLFQNKQIVVKEQQIIFSQDILVFYVNRRHQTNPFTSAIRPYQTPSLPITMNTYERLNSVDVNFTFDIPLPSQTFTLRSAVAVETVNIQEGVVSNNQIILGCSAIVLNNNNNQVGVTYTPLDYGDTSDKKDTNLTPITTIPLLNNVAYKVDGVDKLSTNVFEKLSKQGTIFIYECTSGMEQQKFPNNFP